MKILTLRIENLTTLESGGPISLRLEGKGAQVGRKAGMDWILPDATRHISGHHFDITYEQDNYLLHDVSSNGTFLHGERYRLSEPRILVEGDRINVGHFIICVGLGLVEAPVASPVPNSAPVAPIPDAVPPMSPAAADPFDDVWGDYGSAPVVEPEANALQTPHIGQLEMERVAATQSPDLSCFANASSTPEVSSPPQFTQGGTGGAPFRSSIEQSPMTSPSLSAAPAITVPDPSEAMHVETHQEQPSSSIPEMSSPSSLPEFGSAVPPVQNAAPAYQGDDLTDARFLQAFLEGAGVADPSQLRLPPQELGRMLGRCVREATGEMMRMLQSRAAVKLFISGEDRTMRVANGNNPMKFMTDSERAFETMFLEPRDGYMTGADGFQTALADIRHHQDAVVAALQPALAVVFDGLSPDEIEETTSGSLVGGGSRKYWSEYKRRWEVAASQGENGMLDAFINAFSQHYSESLRNMKTQEPT